jgi:AAHS family 3-hydroxyphenylpropionic acid transporter
MAKLTEPSARATTSVAVIVALCFAVAMLEGYDIQSMGVAAPRMVPALHLTPGQTSWVLTASMFGLIVGAMTGGRIADRIGRRPVLVASVIAFGLFSLTTAATWDYPSLVIARIATGLGLGGAMPNLIAIAADIASPQGARARGRTTTASLIFCGMALGGAAAALFARFAPHGLDWKTVFLVGGAVPLALAPLLMVALPETRPGHAAAATDPRPGYVQTLFGEGRAAATISLWAVYVLTLVVLYLMLNWLPLLVVAKGLQPATAPTASLVFNLSGVAGALALGALVDRWGLRWPMLAAYAALVAGMIGLSRAMGMGPILIWSGLAGFLVIGAQFVLYGAAPAFYPVAGRGTGAGAAVGVGRLGSVLGPLVAGQLISKGASAGSVVLAMVPVVAAAGAALLALTLVGRTDASSPPQ